MPDQPSLREALPALLFRVGEQQRWVQDSPVLPSVWSAFVEKSSRRVDLLITPHRNTRPADLAAWLRSAVGGTGAAAAGPAIAFNQTLVVASLTFEELIRFVVPMSQWFERKIAPYLGDIREIAALKSMAKGSRLSGVLRDIDREPKPAEVLPPLVAWWLRLTGTLSLRLSAADEAELLPVQVWKRSLDLLPDHAPTSEVRLFRISLNRQANVASLEAERTVKADAAQRVFDVDTSRICWAILDSGIDIRHEAFRGDKKGHPRVIASYDFTRIRRLVELASTPGDDAEAAVRSEFGITAAQADRIRNVLVGGGDIDWEALRPALKVKPSAAYFDGLNPHGTHVAGILGGRKPDRRRGDGEDEFRGICPDIRLIDLRILDKSGRSKDDDRHGEFDAIAALQFVAHLNSFSSEPVVHGVNLSIQLQHDPSEFACGRTPVCEECNRLVANGVVVVAAAGNMGIDRVTGAANTTEGAFRGISIADPGNAEAVITVGSTHRAKPHVFGVSFFSSRGPTGDGRMKPDLVAPGEKVIGPVGGKNEYDEMQGTSQAAPFVSGAAAMLLARNSELVGDPARVKAILCRSATDLGRLREFQGAGLLDVLRALQSV
jgi:serine protease AprX